MSLAEQSLATRHPQPPLSVGLRGMVTSPRFYIYLSCTLLAVLTNFHLGKEMLWDTMDYHIYAGFSALHDRFGRDYFAAGPQSYFNPYAYVPFYLLVRSRLTPLEDASILAITQSAILWLTFELALLAASRHGPRISLTIGILAVVFAFANPVLINQFGSSYADITTAEIVLGGWLVLLGAVRKPSATRVVCAALLLGAASALKLTNAVHAISAAALLLFIPVPWRSKLCHAALFVTGICAAFVGVAGPWSLRLEQHFGNPLFPMLNGIFRSPDFTTAPIVDYRFIPASLGAALMRPFAMVMSAPMVHFEFRAPDLRYALLLLLAFLLVVQQASRRLRKYRRTEGSSKQALETRMLAALACGLLLDWTLWLIASGNSRYFIPMACVAAVLGVALVFQLFDMRPKIRNGLLAVVLGVQCVALYWGADYRARLPWTDSPWVDLSMSPALPSQARLYFTLGMQSNSFIIPELAAGSGFINLDGAYVLGPDGANGKHIEALIERYAPHLQVLVSEPQPLAGRQMSLLNPDLVDDTLEPFGLKAVARSCRPVVAHGVTSPPAAHTEYLLSCAVDRIGPAGVPLPGQRAADLALDHLEDACPALFQPRRPVDTLRGDQAHGYVFARRYWNTATLAWVFNGAVKIEQVFDGRKEYVGQEAAWERAPQWVSCGRGALTLSPVY